MTDNYEIAEYEFYIDQLIDIEYVEDVSALTKEEAEHLLQLIEEKTGKKHTLIIHENVSKTGVIYDLALDDSDTNTVLHEQWSLD